MQKSYLDSLPDVLDARDIADVLGIGYVKALKLIRHGGMNYLKLGRVYKVPKQSFIYWMSCTRVIDLD